MFVLLAQIPEVGPMVHTTRVGINAFMRRISGFPHDTAGPRDGRFPR